MAKRKQLFEVDANNNISNTSINRANKKNTLFEVSAKGKVTSHNTSKEKNKNGFFQSSKYFDNGYDFGDISKTFFWSGADLLQDVTRGFSRTIEGTTDTLGYLSADVLDFFGADDTADWLRDVSKYDVTGKLLKPSDYLEQRSVFGNYSDTVFEGVGNVGGMIVTNTVMPGSGATSTMLSSFSSAYGNSMSEALRNGQDLSTARKTAFIHGTAEAISEQIFEGLPGMKTENWGGKAVGKFGSFIEHYFGTNTGKVAMKILNTSGEGFEEIISNMLVSVGNDVMHKIDNDFTYGMEGQTGNIGKDLLKSMTSKESWEQFLSASLTSALTNGGNQFISTTQKNNLIKSYAKENNMTVNQAKNMFNQSVQQKTQTEMQRKPNMDLGQRVETENMAKAKTMQELKRGTFVQPGTETDTYQYAKSENQKVNEMNQSIVDAGGNNTQANKEAAATAKRLIEDLGFNIKFTNNQQLQEQGQNVNGRNINGFVKDGTMYLNLDSDELANFTIGHETKHFFEANKEMNDLLNQSLKEYAQEKGIWDRRLAETTELYTDKDGNLIGDPEGELLADLTGEVFANYEFVNNLSIKNPSLFEKVRSFFQNLYYKATGQKEKLLIKQINDNLNKVYREYAKTQPGNKAAENGDTKYSLGVHYGDLGKARDTNYFAMSSGRRSTGHFGNGTYFVSQEESNRLNNDETFTRKARPQSEIEFDDYNLYKPKIESEGFRLHDGLKAVNYGEYDSTDFEMLKNDLMRNGISEEQINNAINEVERIRQELKDADYKKQVEADSLSTEFMKALGFNGIDVRGLEGLDNTGYGSVIYDLDNKINNEKTLTKDSQGRELSEQQQEYFKDSKVRDENGNLQVVYHGTVKPGFTIFNPSNANTSSFGKYKFKDLDVNYFTASKDTAMGYTNIGVEENGNVYETYLNITNPYIVENSSTSDKKSWLNIKDNNIRQYETDYYNNFENKWNNSKKVIDNIDEINQDLVPFNCELRKSGDYIELWDLGNNSLAGGENIMLYVNENDNASELFYEGIKEQIYGDNFEDYYYTSDDIVKWVLTQNTNGKKYDGIIIPNILDNGPRGSIFGEPTTDYVTFNSNQIKNVDNTNPTDSPDIRYSLSQKEDTDFDELSEKQIEYFKNTKAVDKHGYLETVYHGTPEDFNIFDIEKAGKTGVEFGNGFYFTNSKGTAMAFTEGGLYGDSYDQVKEGYINIEKPASRDTKTISFDEFKKLYNELNNNKNLYDEEMGMSNIDALLSDYGDIYNDKENTIKKFYDSYDNDVTLIDNLSYMANPKEMYEVLRNVTGIDGIIIENPTNYDSYEKYYVAFNPDQFKLKSNKTPTINEDMRYSISQEGELQSDKYKDLFPGMTRSSIHLSDLKRKEVEIPTEQENALKTAENEQKQGEKPTRREVIDRNRQLAREQLGDITQIKDKKRGLLYQINTMKRNLRDIMTKEQAQKMYDTYFKDITTNNAKIENDITSYNERIQKYNLNDKESTYTQMIGELKHNPETTLTKQQVDDFYYKNANKIDQQKCENAVNEFRQIYDELIEKVNDVLTDNGYKPIEYRKGYFPHFIEEKATSKLGKLAEKLGWKVKKGQLPTDIAGITDQFKPGKAWTSFSQQRTGDATDYNALKGLDNYLRGAMDVIYHTNDIQKLRALENEIRYQYSSKGVQDKINEIYADENLDMEEKNDAIANLTSNIRESGLGNFVTEIRNYTDNLANKKAFGDRSMEQTLGRDVYSIMNNINGRVSANMVGANISSAITNFIPITQAWSQLSTKNLMRGMYESIKTSIKGDNFADRSTFLTNRTKQAERLYNTKMDKLTQKLGVPFEAIDSFTSNTIVRAKYYDNIAKGMSEQEAMSNADEFAKDVMAGRSKGDQPTIFNRKNPLFKLFTAFQLEVNNQYGYMFKDIPTNMADEAKRKLVGAFIKMFLGAWLYNEITEKFTGRRAAFDPIDMAVSDVKTLTNEDMDLGDKIQSIVKDTAQEVPFVSGLAGGGRLPIQGAIPYSNPLEMVTKTFEDIGNLDDPKKRKTAINNLKKEWSKPVYYLAFPVAGGQIKKTVEGLSMYDKDLPIAGSYTNSGKLRFEADTSTLGKVQAAVFGQYASKNAREYFKNGYTPLTEGQVEEALEAELPINEYREINQGIKDAKAEAKAKGENQTEAMYDYIYDLPIEMEQKNSLINSRTKGSSTVKDKNGYIKYVDDKGKTYWYDKKNDIVYNSKYKEMDTKDIADLTKASTQKDISNYGNYGSLAEFNYSNKNPEKYLALTKIADYDTFMEYKDELAAIKQRYDNKPTEFKKKKVFEYINSLPLSVEQKLMLQKMGAGYSIKQYRGRLHNYINNMELTKEQKQAIDKVLFD